MSSFYSGNRYLTEAEMKVNASYIYAKMSRSGWTAQSIAGMLGNMETESTINPGIWEGLEEGDYTRGFGLVQWTPATKYTSWCASYGLDPSHMDSAIRMIEYELQMGEQWLITGDYPLSFEDFKKSTESPSYLANAFLHNYERPADTNQPNRAEQAEKWYTYITGLPPVDPGTPDTPGKKPKNMDLLMLILASRRR